MFISPNFSQSSFNNVYSIEKLYEIFNSLTISESDLQLTIDSLISLFNQAYSYTEVAKNPPQPKFNNSYHQKVFIEKELKSINIKNTNMFKFYQEIKLLFDRLADQHLKIDKSSFKLKDAYFTDPLNLFIKEYKNKSRIFATIKPDVSDYKYFRNNDTIFNIIKNNSNVPIKSIKGKDPFDFITEFGGEYEKFKSPQATFRFKFYEHNLEQNFFDYPLPKEDLYNFSVEYENGDKFVTDYVVYSKYIINEKILKEEIKSFFDNIKNNKEENINKILKDLLTFRSDKLYNKIYNSDSKDINEKIFLAADDRMEWDHYYLNEIGCKFDRNKKINIYGVLSFSIDTSPDYINTIKSCTELFDSNNYPIIVVNILNGGGLVTNSQFLIEAVSPKTTVNIYAAFRNRGLFQESPIIKQLTQTFLDIEDCESFSYRTFTKSTKTVDYGNGVSDSILGPLFFNGRGLRHQIYDLRRELKNPRKPTEILLFTDGFSYSATSIFLKYLQYYGGGITVGYFPNPNLKDVPYDSSLSPSSILTEDLLRLLIPDGYKALNNLGYNFIITGSQTFYTPNDFTRPLEYEVTPVDEIVNIYLNDTKDISERFNKKSNYEIFIDESFKILEKYKTKCNKNNKKLVLVSDECDGKFGNEYTHGGYECGENGFWTKNCVPSYCDSGYVFDHINKKCINDVCKPEDVHKKFIIIIIVLLSVIFIAILGFCICYKIQQRNRKKSLLEKYKMPLSGNINEETK